MGKRIEVFEATDDNIKMVASPMFASGFMWYKRKWTDEVWSYFGFDKKPKAKKPIRFCQTENWKVILVAYYLGHISQEDLLDEDKCQKMFNELPSKKKQYYKDLICQGRMASVICHLKNGVKKGWYTHEEGQQGVWTYRGKKKPKFDAPQWDAVWLNGDSDTMYSKWAVKNDMELYFGV